MKIKVFASTLTALLLIFCCVISAGAAQRQDAQYTNPETSYQALIIDELDLLTESERGDDAADKVRQHHLLVNRC